MFFASKYRKQRGNKHYKDEGYVLESGQGAQMAATSFKFDAHSPASEKFKKAVFEWIKTAWDSSLEDDAVAQYAVALVARGTEPRKLTDSLTSVLGSTTASDLCEMLIKYTRLHRDELQLSKSAAKEGKKKIEDSSKVSKTSKGEGAPTAQVSKAPEQPKALRQPEVSSTAAEAVATTAAAATAKPSPAKAAPASQIKAAAPAKPQTAPAAPAKPSTVISPAASAKPEVSKPVIVHEQQVDDLLDEDVSGEGLAELEEDEGAEMHVTDNEEPRPQAQGLAGASRHKKLEWNDPKTDMTNVMAGDRQRLHGRQSQGEEQSKDRALVSAKRHDQVDEPARSKDRAPLLAGQRPSERHPSRMAVEEIRLQQRLGNSHVETHSRDGRRSEPSSSIDHRASKSASPPRVVSPRVRVRSSAVVPGQLPQVIQRRRNPMATLFGKALTGLGEERKLSAKATSTSLKSESGSLAKNVGSKHQHEEIQNPASAAVRRLSEREPEKRPEKRRALSPDPDLQSANGGSPGPLENPSLRKPSVFERLRSTNVDTLKRVGDELDTSSPSKQLRLGREMGAEMISGKGLGRGQGPGPRESARGRGPGPGPRNNAAVPGMVSVVVVPNALKAQPQVPKIVAAVAPSRTPMPGAVPLQKPNPAATAAAALPTSQSEDAIRAEALAIQAKIAMMKAQIEKLTQSADSRTIVVHNVHEQASEAELKDHFRACGTISRTTILKDKPGQAHIEFSSEPGAKAAIGLSETLLKGKTIIVQPKTQASTPGGGSTIPVILKS